VEPTSDGGFVATGVAWSYPPADPGIQALQVIWAFKTDSLGCVVPGCHLIDDVGIFALDLQQHFSLWPNPVARGGAVSIRFTPPPEFTPTGDLRVVLQDALGRMVYTGPWSSPGAQLHELPLRDLPAGIYHIHLADDKTWLAGGKLVVE
jgi:hypothetical protein